MPFPVIPLVAAGASILGGLINSGSAARQNRMSQSFSREMYDRQKADNLEFWRMQNEYNSPQAQMSRYQAAGLNPHLIYGQGNSGNAGSISTPDVQSAQFRSPEWGNAVSGGGLAYMSAIYDLEIKQAQINNLRSQNTVIEQDYLLKRAQTDNVGVGTDRGRFNLDFETELRGTSADARREQLRQTRTSIDLSINKDAREAALNSSNIKEAAERMISLRTQREHTRADTSRIREATSNLLRDVILKDLDIDLRRQGINPHDPMWARIVGRVLDGLYDKYFR